MSNDFFVLSSGEELEQTTEFVAGGIQPLIPEDTQLHVEIVAAKWEEPTTWKKKRIELQLYVVQPGPYRDFVVKDTIKLFDDKVTVVDKAKQKLNTYDTLCKGLLRKAMAAGKNIEDDDALLSRALVGNGLIATFGVWEMEREDGTVMTGNLVKKIGELPKSIKQEDKAIVNKSRNQPSSPQNAQPKDPVSMNGGADDDFDENIPF